MSASGIHYQVRVSAPQSHVFEVSLTVKRPAAVQGFEMAVWIPGSYLVREFAKQVHGVRAQQGERELPVRMTGKATWVVDVPSPRPLTFTYRVMAHDDSVRTAWLDDQRGFFNGTSLFMQVQGQTESPVTVTLEPVKAKPQWQLATAMTAVKTNRQGFGTYRAEHYDELVDHPVEMGHFWSGAFQVRGVPHRLVVAGAGPRFDGPRLLKDTQRICETAMQFWHGKGKPPFDRYVFLLNTTPDGYGGLEHRHSTALLAPHSDLPRLGEAKAHEGYLNLLGLISHEYFHTWNVKRLRPAELASYRYDQENLTELLWFFEGFTSYYDDLLLCRAGLMSAAQYLARVQKTLLQVEQSPGRHTHSLAQASFEAWTKFYRPDAQTPNLTVSYYAKGSLLALCWDLQLRNEGHSLDEVMRTLWQQCQGGPMTEADWLAALRSVRGRSAAAQHRRWTHGTTDLPVHDLLSQHGVGVKSRDLTWPQRLGLRIKAGTGVHVTHVLQGGWADQAGLAPGDEWVSVADAKHPDAHWRLMELADLELYAPSREPLTAGVFRGRRAVQLQTPPLSQAPASGQQLTVKDARPLCAWLGITPPL